MTPVTGRFAPSPSGPLHAGSLVAAMASWLDVRSRGGRWLVRIEDLDGPRVVAGATAAILDSLAAHGFRWDGPVVLQSERLAHYDQAFERLRALDVVYPCSCSRRDLDVAGPSVGSGATGPIYPGTCRHGLAAGRSARAWRLRVPSGPRTFYDRAAGSQTQDLAAEVGDFVIRRADGLWAYQLAVVVDDAEQGVTDVVRGLDLIDSTPRQRWLQELLGLPHPRTLHVPLVTDGHGHKLAKSRGAIALAAADALTNLHAAARHLDLGIEPADSIGLFWDRATAAWASRWPA